MYATTSDVRQHHRLMPPGRGDNNQYLSNTGSSNSVLPPVCGNRLHKLFLRRRHRILFPCRLSQHRSSQTTQSERPVSISNQQQLVNSTVRYIMLQFEYSNINVYIATNTKTKFQYSCSEIRFVFTSVPNEWTAK